MILLAAFAAALLQDPLPASPQPLIEKPLTAPPADRRAQRRVCGGGAVVYASSEPLAPTAEMTLFLHAGDYLDPAGKEGLTAMLAEVWNGAGAAVPRAHIEFAVSDCSGELRLSCRPADFAACLAALAERMRRFEPAAADVDAARSALLHRLERRHDDTAECAEAAWLGLVRGKHTSTRVPSEQALQSIGAADLQALAQRIFFPRNFFIAVRAPLAESEILDALENATRGWPNVDAPLAAPAEPEAGAAPGVYCVPAARGASHAMIMIGFPTLRRDHADRPIVDAVWDALASPVAPGSLDQSLRIEKNLAPSLQLRVHRGDAFRGDAAVALTTTAAQAVNATKAVLLQLRALGEERPAPETLARVRASLADRARAADVSMYRRMQRFAREELLRVDAEEASRDRSRWESMSGDDWIRVARRCFDPAKAIVLVAADPDRPELDAAAWAGVGTLRRIERQ